MLIFLYYDYKYIFVNFVFFLNDFVVFDFKMIKLMSSLFKRVMMSFII